MKPAMMYTKKSALYGLASGQCMDAYTFAYSSIRINLHKFSIPVTTISTMCDQERIMKEGKGRGEGARSAYNHLIENSKLTHAGLS